GHVVITFVPGQRYETSNIQIKEFGQTTTPLSELAATFVSRIDLIHILSSLIFGFLIIFGVRKSLSAIRDETLGNKQYALSIRNVWWAIATLLALFILIRLWL